MESRMIPEQTLKEKLVTGCCMVIFFFVLLGLLVANIILPKKIYERITGLW